MLSRPGKRVRLLELSETMSSYRLYSAHVSTTVWGIFVKKLGQNSWWRSGSTIFCICLPRDLQIVSPSVHEESSLPQSKT